MSATPSVRGVIVWAAAGVGCLVIRNCLSAFGSPGLGEILYVALNFRAAGDLLTNEGVS